MNKVSIAIKHLLLKGLLLAPVASVNAYAQGEPNSDVTLTEMSWIDAKYFDKKRAVVDALGRENFGTRLRGSTQDIDLIQRILEGQHVTILIPKFIKHWVSR